MRNTTFPPVTLLLPLLLLTGTGCSPRAAAPEPESATPPRLLTDEQLRNGLAASEKRMLEKAREREAKKGAPASVPPSRP